MKRLKLLLLGVATSLTLSACDFDVYELPLPGGTDTGADPMVVTVMFRDVLDLVPKSTVKVNDVSVGEVTEVDLDGYVAKVTLEVRSDVELPDNAVAELRQTSLLGEKFVSLSAPQDETPTGALESGDTIPLDRSGRNPEVEEVLGALSLVLNGGGVAQLKTIASELNEALEGREDSAKSVLSQIELLMSQLDDGKGDIVRAIESLNRLAISVNEQTDDIDLALEEMPSALRSLDKQRDDLVRMLKALNRLGDVGVRVIRESKRSTIESFRQLSPVLTELGNAGDDFANAFHVFLTYPFVDEVVGRDPQVARNLHMGDYTNLSIEMDFKITKNNPTPPTNLPSVIDPTVIVDNVQKCIESGDLQSKACKKVISDAESLEELREECRKPQNENKDVCRELNLVPGLPTPSSSAEDGGPLDGITGGLGRAAHGPLAERWSAQHGPTMGQLMAVYDPTLVHLLVPGMVTR
ncbi:MCE family protein [Nocardioides sp. GCM10027113]|uniref:MCE family protein n=1 Tax=unclassified Nocardioides TaxID=2615069 RepID=UPI00361F52E6